MLYDGESFLKGRFLPAALVALAAFLAFGLSLRVGFIWDDHRMIEQNPRLAVTAANVAHAFKSDLFDQGQNYYRPLQTLTNMATFAVWGYRPFGYHLTNLLFHAAAAVLFYWLALALGFRPAAAFWSAAWLAAHPSAAELLLNNSGMSELAAAACTLAALLLFLRGRPAVSFAFFAAAVGFKETGVITPALIALCLWHLKRDKKEYLKLVPFLAFIPVYLFIRHAALGMGTLSKGLLPVLSGLFLKVPQCVLVYLGEAALPFDIYSHRLQPVSALLRFTALPALAAAGLFLWKKGGSTGRLCAAWYLVNLAPKLPPLATNDLMLDHWVYLANAGCFLWAADLLAGLKGRWRLLPAAAAVVLAAASALNVTARNTDLKLYEYSARRSTSKPMLYNLAREYFLLGRAAESRAILEKITAVEPGNHLYLNGLALARWRTGEVPGALAAIETALAAKPDDAETLFNKYSILAGTGGKKAAAAVLEELLAASPPHLPALLEAARLAASAGRQKEAASFFERALAANPYEGTALNDYGILLAKAGKYGEAEVLFRRALKISPAFESARRNLARLETLKNK